MFICPSFDCGRVLWLDLLNMNQVTPSVVWGWTYTGCGIICRYSWHESAALDEPFLERNARWVQMPICHPVVPVLEFSRGTESTKWLYMGFFFRLEWWYSPGRPMVVSYWSGRETGSCSAYEAGFISEAPNWPWMLEGSRRVTGLQFMLEAWRHWFSHPGRNPAVKR